MSKFEKNMEKFFEIEEDISSSSQENLPAPKTKTEIMHENFEADFAKDYEVARENFHDLIEKGKDAIDDILAIARESEKGRDFEVAATLIKNVVEANEKMIDLHKKIREISNYKSQTENLNKTNITNAVFVGSTSELSKLVKDLNTKDITPD